MQLDSPRISVIIPTFNRESTIARALSSVLAQTLPPCEIIVVDDGSTDGTTEAIAAFEADNVQLLCMARNSGAQAARNRGIIHACGEWIAFLDSDDVWHPEKLERQTEVLRRFEYDSNLVVHTNCLVVRADGRTEDYGVHAVLGDRPLAQILAKPGPMFQGMLMSKAALEDAGLLDESVPSYQEWDTSILLAERCRFYYIREPLFTYHQDTGVTMSADTARDFSGYDFIVAKHRTRIITVLGHQGLRNHVIGQTRRAIGKGQWRIARRYLHQLKILGEPASGLARLRRHFFISVVRYLLYCLKTATSGLFSRDRRPEAQ